MTLCEDMRDRAAEYASGSLTREERREYLLHLARCSACRVELAREMALHQALRQSLLDVPEDILASAFSLLPQPDETGELQEIVDGGGYGMAFDLVRYALSPVRDVMGLVQQVI